MKKLGPFFFVPLLVASVSWAAVSLAAEVPSQVFSINHATVGFTTLDQIRETYGIAQTARVSRDDGADIVMCYAHSARGRRSFLVFESGAMGGFTRITGFRLSLLAPSVRCASTTIDIGALATGNGIQLRQSRVDFENALPVEFRRRGSQLIYEAVSRRVATAEEQKRLRVRWPESKQDYFDVTITIKAKFSRDRLIDLYVHKIESY